MTDIGKDFTKITDEDLLKRMVSHMYEHNQHTLYSKKLIEITLNMNTNGVKTFINDNAGYSFIIRVCLCY